MKKTKIIVATAMIAIMMIMAAINVFAAVTATIALTPRKTTVAPGEEFTVEVKAENIDSVNGLSKVEGTLSYDNKVLNEITRDDQIEGMSGWKITFDSFSKRITASSTTPVKANGPVFQISFKVRSDIAQPSQTGQTGTTNNGNSGINLSGGNQQSLSLGGTNGGASNTTNIEFKSIKFEGGLEQGTANDVSTTINIGQASQQPSTPTPAPTQPNINQQPTPSPAPTPTPAPTQPSRNPKAGIEDTPIILMAALAVVATISFVLLKRAK